MRSALFQLDTMEVLVSLLASGRLREVPRLQLRARRVGRDLAALRVRPLDTEYHDRARSLGFKMKPSDYFRRQGYVTYQQDKFLEPIVPLIGEDNIIWGADYPHPGLHLAELARAPREEPRRPARERAAKITYDNVVKLYNLR